MHIGCLIYQQPIFLSPFFVDMRKRKKYTAPVFNETGSVDRAIETLLIRI